MDLPKKAEVQQKRRKCTEKNGSVPKKPANITAKAGKTPKENYISNRSSEVQLAAHKAANRRYRETIKDCKEYKQSDRAWVIIMS